MECGSLRCFCCRRNQDYRVTWHTVSFTSSRKSCTSLTSDEQHLALLLDCPHARLLVLVFLLRNVYGLFDVSENEVAMRVVCLDMLLAMHVHIYKLLHRDSRVVCP